MQDLAGIALLTLAIGWCAQGCGSDSRAADPRSGSLAEVHDFLERISKIACAGAASCCGVEGPPFDEAACLRDATPVLPFGFSDFRDTPHFMFDEAEADRCLDAFQAAMTMCHDPPSQVDAQYHCSLVFRGDVADHGRCVWFGDCAYSPHAVTTCFYSGDTKAYGSCQGAGPRMPWTGLEGEQCLTTCVRDNAGNANCPPPGADAPILAGCFIEDGLFCDGTCERLPSAGEPCEGNYCTPDAYCDGGTCKLRGAGACGISAQCTSHACREGACASRAPLGSSCEDPIECESEFCPAGLCETGSYPTDSVCALYPAD